MQTNERKMKMKKHIFDLLISLLKEPEWRSELPRVCPKCCGEKSSDEDCCCGCINREMDRFRSDTLQESYQGNGFSVGNNYTHLQLGRWLSYIHTDGETKHYWREIG